MVSSKWVRVGSVRRFDYVEPDKEQALKVLEEAVKVIEAWKDLEWTDQHLPNPSADFDVVIAHNEAEHDLLDSCADVIQATLNLVAALGVEDFRPWMKECEKRNRERERITDGKVDE